MSFEKTKLFLLDLSDVLERHQLRCTEVTATMLDGQPTGNVRQRVPSKVIAGDLRENRDPGFESRLVEALRLIGIDVDDLDIVGAGEYAEIGGPAIVVNLRSDDGDHGETTSGAEPKALVKYALVTVLDQTIGFLAEDGSATTKHPNAKLLDSLEDASMELVRASVRDALSMRRHAPDFSDDAAGDEEIVEECEWMLCEVHDEAEFRAREDTW